MEGDEGNLRGAVEAEGQAHGAYTAIDIELHAIELVDAFRISPSQGGQDERAKEGKLNLAAVGVPGEHEIDEWATRMGGDVVCVVGLVGHEQDRSIRLGWDGKVQIGVAGAGVIDARNPDPCAGAFDGDILVDENGSAVSGQGLSDR